MQLFAADIFLKRCWFDNEGPTRSTVRSNGVGILLTKRASNDQKVVGDQKLHRILHL